jgi:hypothetical protein
VEVLINFPFTWTQERHVNTTCFRAELLTRVLKVWKLYANKSTAILLCLECIFVSSIRVAIRWDHYNHIPSFVYFTWGNKQLSFSNRVKANICINGCLKKQSVRVGFIASKETRLARLREHLRGSNHSLFWVIMIFAWRN